MLPVDFYEYQTIRLKCQPMLNNKMEALSLKTFVLSEQIQPVRLNAEQAACSSASYIHFSTVVTAVCRAKNNK